MKTYLALISAAALALAACSQEKPAAPAAPATPSASAPAASEASAAPASNASTPVEASAPTASAPAASAPAAPASEATPASEAKAEAPAADNCSVTVDSTDQMTFSTNNITIDKAACKEFTIKLTHSGKMPRNAMGHNIVISKSEDKSEVVKDAAAAGVDNDFVKPNDERVIAYTKLIGGGEETSVTVDTSKFVDGSKYEFYCSFPGHFAGMAGHIIFK